MPIRTTDEAIRDIADVDDGALGPSGLDPFIISASRLVDRYCDVVTNPDLAATHDPPYSESELEEIERYLAAHFYASSRDMRIASETVSSLQNAFQMKTDFYLALTHFGQHAIVLDHYGGLAAAQQALVDDDPPPRTGIAVGVFWGGKDYNPYTGKVDE